jgi:glycosyltransferase involved in cell wall biosynthesis
MAPRDEIAAAAPTVGQAGAGLPGPLLLDVTRSLSRIGQGPLTGIDRVERAWIAEALRHPGSRFIARSGRGAILCDGPALRQVLGTLDGLPAPARPGLLARLFRRRPLCDGALATLARLGQRSASPEQTARLLADRMPRGFVHASVGHANLSDTHLSAVRQGGAGCMAVMVHDLIPLDHPDYCRRVTPPAFATAMRAGAEAADLLICNSRHTEGRLRDWLAHWGLDDRRSVVAPLGTGPLAAPGALPAGVRRDAPRFVVLGTIEPRKNHALLLDLWEEAGEDGPHLHIVGRRGWENRAVFDRLDRSVRRGRTLFEHGNLPDAGVAALLDGARALLFPSHAEGFGLPLAEALARGVPVIASDLPAFREIAPPDADGWPVYLHPDDRDGWRTAIGNALSTKAGQPRAMPGWPGHFAIAGAAMRAVRR